MKLLLTKLLQAVWPATSGCLKPKTALTPFWPNANRHCPSLSRLIIHRLIGLSVASERHSNSRTQPLAYLTQFIGRVPHHPSAISGGKICQSWLINNPPCCSHHALFKL